MPEERLRMRQELGLLEGVVVILGIIFGCGIFITPREVILNTGSIWAALIVWTICGVVAAIGATCYAELGTMLARSGGDYHYINEAYGALPAFLYLWDAVLIIIPTTNAIMALSFASTILYPVYTHCPVDPICQKLVAAVSICLLTFVNSYNVRITTRFQNVFILILAIALASILLAGIVWIVSGKCEYLKTGWAGTSTSPSDWAVAFFAGVFSYNGWSYLNIIVEELKDPYRNLPRAICISLPVVTCVYVLVNFAYLAVLGPEVVIKSNSVALDFIKVTVNFLKWIMPILISVAIFGALSIHIMTSARICFAGARNGHMPQLLAYINIKCLSPMPSLLFLMFISLLMLLPDSLTLLITYSVIVETFFTIVCCSIVIYLRFKMPNLKRPIKVSLCWPIIFVVVHASLLLFPIFSQPLAIICGLVITLCGIPAYYLFVKHRPNCVQRFSVNITLISQKLFLTALEEPNAMVKSSITLFSTSMNLRDN